MSGLINLLLWAAIFVLTAGFFAVLHQRFE